MESNCIQRQFVFRDRVKGKDDLGVGGEGNFNANARRVIDSSSKLILVSTRQ